MTNKRTLCKKRVKNALSCTLYAYSSKYLIFKTSHWSKVINKTIWDFFLAPVQIFLKLIIFNIKVFKLQRESSVTLNVNLKTPISAWKFKITSKKIQVLPYKFFPEWFGQKEIESIRFWKYCMTNQLKLMFQKKCVFQSQKGSNIWNL